MVQGPEQELSHTANTTPRRRRDHPRVNHACQRCRAKKAKCDQQQPCLTCVKHAAHCEYGIRKRSGRKKQRACQSGAETPGARLSLGFTTRSNIRSDESELREHPHETTLSGTQHNLLLQFLAAFTLLTLNIRSCTSSFVHACLRRRGRC